jgi:hypothetical protein
MAVFFRPIAATRMASQAKNTLLSERRTLALEKFKYALKSWRHTPAIARLPSA